MKWFELNEESRIKEVYSKFNINDFFTWWQNGKNSVMEVRIKDFELIKQHSKELNLPYSVSGFYINNSNDLKRLIKLFRDKTTIWFGINSRKKNYNKFNYKSYSGKDNFINNIDYIFIDIDRVNKIGNATNKELENANILADKILSKLSEHNWNKRYIKICSGNGVQLLVGLDINIVLPNIEYSMEKKCYGYNEEMEQLKIIIKEGIGKNIKKFCDKFKEELMCEIDTAGFTIGRVGALPFTKNYKYNSYTWRGIVEMENGINEGLTDYILSFKKDIKVFKENNVFKQNKYSKHTDLIKDNELLQHILIRFILDNDLPYGKINNVLWMQIKCLLRDNKLSFDNKYAKEFHKLLEEKYKGAFTTNFPDEKFMFKEETINKYCAEYLIKPLFELKKLRVVNEGFNLNIDWEQLFLVNGEKVDIKGEDIFEDMYNVKSLLTLGNKGKEDNNLIVYKFANSCIEKYGLEKTKYFFENWFYYYIGYR